MESDIVIEKIEYIGRAKKSPIDPLSVKDVIFKRGKTTALIGANGSGKSTLLNTLAGLRPDFTITAHFRYQDTPPPNRYQFGYASQQQNFPAGAKVKDVVKFHQSVYRVASINEGLAAILPDELMELTYDKMSGGQRQRVNLYYALAHSPNLAIVDEPESSLDDKMIRHVASLLKNRSVESKTTLVATHNAKVLAVADNVLVIEKGKVTFNGSMEALIKERLGGWVLEVSFADEQERQTLLSVVLNDPSCKLYIELEDDKTYFFGEEALESLVYDSPLAKKRMGINWRLATAKDLLLSLDQDCKLPNKTG